ncbi:MAG: hypothetical protein DRO12_04225 [Thermoprotei archaeon]|nr:MAG: hypothetical protein DRO12_04225 [Thermoprotei archaeon]
MFRVYVFDIDGVILDVRERLRYAKELSRTLNTDFMQVFLSEELLLFDKPRRVGLELLKERMSRGRIALITGRPRRLHQATVEQLRSVGIDVSKIWRIFMRSNNDRRPAPLVKLDFLDYIESVGGCIAEVHDNEEDLLKLVKSMFPGAKLYLHEDDSYRLY